MALKSTNDDAVLQVRAARALLIGSHLVQLVDDGLSITPFDDFKGHWEKLDDKFGRLLCWAWFSAGNEYLIKGYLLANGVEIRNPSTETKDYYGTLKGCIPKLRKVGMPASRLRSVMAHYESILKVRNRDLHYYKPDVRDADYWSLEGWIESLDFLYRSTSTLLKLDGTGLFEK